MTRSARSFKMHNDKRRFQRVQIELNGRYMLPSKAESDCRVLEMSPGNVVVASDYRAKIGDNIILYVDKLGRFNGRVERVIEGGFALSVENSPSRRDKLADTLTWYANKDLLTEADESRGSERVVPLIRRTLVKTRNGKEILAKILDVSCVGVGLESSLRPEIGTEITVGHTPAKVVRHFATGFACSFVTPFPTNGIDESAVL